MSFSVLEDPVVRTPTRRVTTSMPAPVRRPARTDGARPRCSRGFIVALIGCGALFATLEFVCRVVIPMRSGSQGTVARQLPL